MNLLDNVNGLKQIKSYNSLLEEYKEILIEYQKKLESISVTDEDKMTAVQVALDLTYLKEELDVMRPSQDQMANDVKMIEGLIAQITTGMELAKDKINRIEPYQEEILQKIDAMDTTIIEPIKKNYTANRNAINEKLDEVMEVVKTKSGSLKTALIISLILNVISMGCLAFLILYLFGAF